MKRILFGSILALSSFAALMSPSNAAVPQPKPAVTFAFSLRPLHHSPP